MYRTASDTVPELVNLLPSAHRKALASDALHIGVLALQGAFAEHANALGQLGARVTEVRQLSGLTEDLDGLIIPGGESTTMAIVARTLNMVEPLQQYVRDGRPIFGTCAGLIFLSERVTGQKIGGQSVVGGLDVVTRRNFFGSQIDSAERHVVRSDGAIAAGTGAEGAADDQHFRHVFIRAPAIVHTGKGVQVLATLTADAHETALLKEQFASEGLSGDPERVIVAVQQGFILATAFHPELTEDLSWHQHFLEMVRAHKLEGR